MPALALAVVFASAALIDVLGCLWARARERAQAGQRAAYVQGAGIAALLELVQWAPVVFALETAAPLQHVVVASVLGSVVGSLAGFRAARAV